MGHSKSRRTTGFNWKNKKVLVTGAGGFIGSHLCEHLVALGARVRALVHYNALGKWGWLEESHVKHEMEVILGDVTDRDSVDCAVKDQEVVFHLAALISIPYSYHAPFSYVQTNIVGTVNVLQAARRENVRSLVHTSTSETYGTAQYVPIDERHPLVGQSPYAASKIGADQLCISFHKSFGVPVKIVRPFNTYGPRQSARAVIPTIITQISTGNEKIKLGNVFTTRDLTYVKDTARGFVAIAESPKNLGEVTNIGNHSEISIRDLASRIASLMKRKIKIVEDPQRVRPSASEVERLWCNNEKIKKTTSWQPQYDLDSGLKETIEWIDRNSLLYKSHIYMV